MIYYIIAGIFVIAVYYFTWCLCKAAKRNDYPDIEDVK